MSLSLLPLTVVAWPPSRYQAGADAHHAFGNMAQYCARGCPSSWIGDKYCDRACKVPECAMDAGDCGLDALRESVHGTSVQPGAAELEIPPGVPACFLNLTALVGADGRITDGSHDRDDAVRTATISQQHKIMIMTLHNNVSRVPVQVSIVWEGPNATSHNASFRLIVGGSTTTTAATADATVVTETASEPTSTTAAASVEPAPNNDDPGGRQLLSLRAEAALKQRQQQQQQQQQQRQQRELHPMGGGQELGSDDFPWAPAEDAAHNGRRLLDVYGDSLKYVNALYNRHFSSEPRKVLWPSCSAPLIASLAPLRCQRTWDT